MKEDKERRTSRSDRTTVHRSWVGRLPGHERKRSVVRPPEQHKEWDRSQSGMQADTRVRCGNKDFGVFPKGG